MIFAHFRKTWNLGDESCCPGDYFPQFRDCRKVDMQDIPDDDQPLVIGGGGLLFAGMDSSIQRLSETRPVILWGAGLNYPRDSVPNNWQSYLSLCKLVGLRDNIGLHPYHFAPCPSCMHPGFLTAAPDPRYPAVVYSHCGEYLDGEFPGFPAMVNTTGPGKSLERAIRFLSLGWSVITNSFHGAYWSLLLGRRVILYRPLDSTRYYTALSLPPAATSVEDVIQRVEAPWECNSNRNYLTQCRAQTEKFCGLVEGYR